MLRTTAPERATANTTRRFLPGIGGADRPIVISMLCFVGEGSAITAHPDGMDSRRYNPGIYVLRTRLVQLRLRLRLVPVRPRRDVPQLRLEEIVQELLLRILHFREDLAGGRRADAVDRIRVHGPLPVDRHEVGDLLRAGEEFSFFVREIQ